MRFLLVSDLHYALQQYDWTTAVAPQFDAVVIAGDHLDGRSSVDGSVQIVVILKCLARMMNRTRLLVSSGNHDLDTRDGGGERVARWMERVRALGIPTDGDSIVIAGAAGNGGSPNESGGIESGGIEPGGIEPGGNESGGNESGGNESGGNESGEKESVASGDTLVTICPWWDGETARRKIGGQISRDFARRRNEPALKTWAWVYHAPPSGSPTCWDGQKHYGDAALIKWIEFYQPDFVFTGHIHQAPFCADGSWIDRIGKTWIFNSGSQAGRMPAHVVVDTAAREAAWFSLQGAQSASLAQPLTRPLPPLTTRPSWMPALAV